MRPSAVVLLLSWLFLLCKPSLQEPLSGDIQRLLADLMSSYDRRVLPILHARVPVNVSVGFTLLHLKLDWRNEPTLGLWGNFQWSDPRLSWDPAEYGGVKDIRLSPDQLWTPDILPYNQLPITSVDWLSPTLVVIKHDGSLLWVPTTSLQVSGKRSPDSDQFTCKPKFGSWTRHSGQLNLTLSSGSVDISSYVADPEWELVSATLARNAVTYACCPEEYVDVTIDLELHKSTPVMKWPNVDRDDRYGVASTGSKSVSPHLPMALLVTIMGSFIKTFNG